VTEASGRYDLSDIETTSNFSTSDKTLTSTGADLCPVCDPVPVPTLVIAWTPSCLADRRRIGERLVLRGRQVSINRLAEVFPGGRLDDREISRVHAEMFRSSSGGWYVRDNGSKNGTSVNGDPVVGPGGQSLESGDVIRLGDTLLLFCETLFPAPVDAFLPTYTGVSDSAREVRTAVNKYADSTLPVLVTGESGVGKEVVSRALASLGRPNGPLVEFNAANVGSTLAGTTLFGYVKGAFTDARESRPGLFRAADGGTLFIDEVGELPRDVQAQLLRVLEDGLVLPVGGTKAVKTDVRVVAATNRDLRDGAAFRSDLYMRLAQFTIHISPVRYRREDILLFALEFSGGRAFSIRAMERLLVHPWPLNVREIRGIVAQTVAEAGPGDTPLELPRVVLERLAKMAAEADADTRPAGSGAPATSPVLDVDTVRQALASAAGNMSVAARTLGKDRAQLYRIVRRFGLNPEDFR
jgi:transcriptional regulator with AAA-type ATPase domain